MMSLASRLVLLGALAGAALGHGTVTDGTADGKAWQGFLLEYYYKTVQGQAVPDHVGWYAENLDNGFVAPSAYSSPDIICHKNASPANTTTASVAAGGEVVFQWTSWPDSHIGPVITYAANCNGDCSAVDKTSLKWIKIDEAGYDTDKKQWAAVKLIQQDNKWSVKIPEGLAAGNWVLRHEIIALHGAGSKDGAQNYPQCVNVAITGSGTDNPEGTLGTALYTDSDPGILFNPYATITSYTIPGPALYSGASSGSGSSGSGSSGSGSSGSGSGSGNSTAPAASTTLSTIVKPAATGSSCRRA